MDVTFRESESYFHPPLQGEHRKEEKMSFPSSLCSPNFQLQRESVSLKPIPNNDIQGESPKSRGRLNGPDLRIYTRRNKTDIAIEQEIVDQPKSLDSIPEYPKVCDESPLVPKESNFNSQSTFPSSNNGLDIPIALRKGVRTCTKHPISNFNSYDSLSPSYRAFLLSVFSVSIPQDWKKACLDPKWKAAMVEEMKALAKNETWELVTFPMGKKSVGCKWVFIVKHKADGSIERYKARLVAKGFTQTYGVDYQKTFASVAKMNTIRILLSCAVNLEWDLQQFDVKNVFLHSDLEVVYMKIPPGFENRKTKRKVFRLKKALYGLKQPPWA
ncbi:retrovirus-related Pol polyprotein from transposon RE2 [Hevea brasiliensis]|uniref:retrovirus-related Pol polyprotein from transposon RE2 n=1 Tax=Hevea brasiliensis TaxID=3981 RepID=UPI0025E43F62|nr:retrovirus-related Pol polyprotein from transposon RE2 [Hevea brasiliensis]XP_058006047.1 retrovirus-related Pol polyprotein from transposon RE2 [Hevea brasiliensis]